MRYVVYTFAGFGFVLTTLLLVGVVLDVRDFDRTEGGYDPPYTDFTGSPVDWDSMDLRKTGLVKRGYVVNVLIDGRTGMISFEIFRQVFNFRPFSERALAVHKPREADRVKANETPRVKVY